MKLLATHVAPKTNLPFYQWVPCTNIPKATKKQTYSSQHNTTQRKSLSLSLYLRQNL